MNSIRISLLFLMVCWLISGCQFQKRNETEKPGKLILYIGTYTEKEAHVAGKAAGIYIYEFDQNTGALKYIGTSPGTINPSFINISKDGAFLYAVNETAGDDTSNTGSISAFRIADNGTRLELINRVSSEGTYPCYVESDHSGKFVFAANYGTGNVSLFSVKENGGLNRASISDQHTGKGPTSRQESAHAHSIVVSADNRFAYSCDLGTDQVYCYRLTDSTMKLSGTYSTQPGAGPRHLAFHPTLNVVYVINELNATVECLRRDTLTGVLSRFQIIQSVNGDPANAGSADIHITPTGEFLYATNRGTFNNIACFKVNLQTGELSLTALQSVRGKTPRNFIIDPTGTWLLVANQDSDNVVTFRIHPVTGELIDRGIETHIPTPVCLKFGAGINQLQPDD